MSLTLEELNQIKTPSKPKAPLWGGLERQPPHIYISEENGVARYMTVTEDGRVVPLDEYYD